MAEGRPLQLAAAPGLLTLFFSPDPVADFAGAAACDLDAHARFCRAMLDRGVYPPPSQFEAWFVSLAHDEATIDRTLEAAADSLEEALERLSPAEPARSSSPSACARPKRRSQHHVIDPDERPVFGLLAALGPRSAAAPGEYAFVVEAVREGYLLHYGEPRLLAGHDDDLALLAGDYLYALGIDRLAALGDTEAVAVLGDLIGRCAQLHAEERLDEVRRAVALGRPRGRRQGPWPPPQRRESIDSVLLRLSC